MKDLVKAEAVSGCITTDCWTSRSNMSYIAITLHFAMKIAVLLGCHELRKSYKFKFK